MVLLEYHINSYTRCNYCLVMKSVKERIGHVLTEIINVVYDKDADQHRMSLDQEPTNGWVDGFLETPLPKEFLERYGAPVHRSRGITTRFVNKYYFAVFDLDHTTGRQLRDQFFGSTINDVTYDFHPTPSFEVKGSLRKRGVLDNLEWAVLATTEQL